jgi:hypothetical protein
MPSSGISGGLPIIALVRRLGSICCHVAALFGSIIRACVFYPGCLFRRFRFHLNHSVMQNINNQFINATPFGTCALSPQQQLVANAVFEHLLLSALGHQYPVQSFQVYRLYNGCFLWVHYSGLRFISPLPF